MVLASSTDQSPLEMSATYACRGPCRSCRPCGPATHATQAEKTARTVGADCAPRHVLPFFMALLTFKAFMASRIPAILEWVDGYFGCPFTL